jgi:DNA-binding HxlR family transcriptional regulator
METISQNVQAPEDHGHSFSEISTYDAGVCIMTRIIDLMSGRWKPIILYLIKNNVNRFGSLQRHMPKISKKVLTNQLRELERDNLISRQVIEAKHPQIVIYHLTEKGLSLRILIDEMIQWGLLNLEIPDAALSRLKISLSLSTRHGASPALPSTRNRDSTATEGSR